MQTTSNSNINSVLNQKVDIDKRVDLPGVKTVTTGKTSFNENFDDFLKLLVAQLQYQDPTDPAKSSDFTNQLVLFSGVEQQISTNAKLEKLLASFEQSSRDSAPNYLGKEVEVPGSEIKLIATAQNINIHYSLDSFAKEATIEIVNSKGSVVDSAKVPSGTGDQYFTWKTAGKAVPPGSYSYRVSATDKDDNAVNVTQYTTVKIAGVGYDKNNVLLISDVGVAYPLDKVQAIRNSNDNQLQLQEILSTLQGSGNTALLQYIGRDIEVENNNFRVNPSSGNHDLRYQIHSNKGVSATLKILDSSSKEVYTKAVDFQEGSYDFIWNEKQSDGSDVADGDYRVFIEVLDSKGNPIPNFIYTKERVVSVDQQSTPTKLITESGQTFAFTQITRI